MPPCLRRIAGITGHSSGHWRLVPPKLPWPQPFDLQDPHFCQLVTAGPLHRAGGDKGSHLFKLLFPALFWGFSSAGHILDMFPCLSLYRWNTGNTEGTNKPFLFFILKGLAGLWLRDVVCTQWDTALLKQDMVTCLNQEIN